MLPYTFSARRAASDIYAPPIRINYATRNRKYGLKDIGARYYDANERSARWNPLGLRCPPEIHEGPW